MVNASKLWLARHAREVLFVAFVTIVIALPLRALALDTIPPGLSQDEAAEALDAQRIALDGARPVFLPSNNGREPLYAYVAALTFWLFGPGISSLRLASALLGVLTVPATYLFARALFSRRVAAIAAMLLAASLWHVHLSRLAMRIVPLPLFEALSVFLVWQALRTGRFHYWAGAGLALGLSLYTYLPARLFGALLLFTTLLYLLFRRASPHKTVSQLAGLALAAAVALAVFAPLGLYFAGNPEDFMGRAGQVSIANAVSAGADVKQVLLENTKSTLGMFFISGDANPRHNLPGRPAFDLLLAPFFVLGLLLALRKLHDPASALLLLWFVVMLVPAILSDSAPHFLRAAGLLPALFVLPALGIDHILRHGGGTWRRPLSAIDPLSLSQKGEGEGEGSPDPVCPAAQSGHSSTPSSRLFTTGRGGLQFASPSANRPSSPLSLWERARVREPRRLLPALLVCLVLSTSLSWTVVDYFFIWPFREDARESFDADKVIAADYINGLTPQFRVFLSPLTADHATVKFLARHPDLTLFGHDVLPLADRSSVDTAYVILGSPSETLARLKRFFPAGYTLQETAPGNRPALASFFVPRGSSVQGLEASIGHPVRLRLGDEVELLGYDVTGDVKGGAVAYVTLYWRSLRATDGDYTTFVHLVGRDGRTWAQVDQRPGAGDYPTLIWRKGEIVLDRYGIPLGVDLVPGTYTLRVGMYSASTGRLPILAGASASQSNQASIGDVSVERGVDTAKLWQLPIERPVNTRFVDADRGDELELLGFRLGAGQVRQGDAQRVMLWWQAKNAIKGDYLVNLALEGASGQVLAEHRVRPAEGSYATTNWTAAQVVRDVHDLVVPADSPPGPADIKVYLADAQTGRPLRVQGATGDSPIRLGPYEILARERRFDIPRIQHPLRAELGEAVTLLGYDLDQKPVRPGDVIRLTLYWQTRARMDESYTVFTHILDAGERIRGQKDQIPLGGKAPTTSWVPGEVTQDVYDIQINQDAAPGTHLLEIGMYHAPTGRRLPVMLSGQRVPGDRVILGKVELVAR
ncbi:MAG: glycosyltransferase family 39 protein [Chloroflexi bacterium]|nr:glycosyltransferase family 39 protein [Chloroflexota bacterium]